MASTAQFMQFKRLSKSFLDWIKGELLSPYAYVRTGYCFYAETKICNRHVLFMQSPGNLLDVTLDLT